MRPRTALPALLLALLAGCAGSRPADESDRPEPRLPGMENPLTVLLMDRDSLRLSQDQADSIQRLAEALDRRNRPVLERVARLVEARRREARGRVEPPTTGPVSGRPDRQPWTPRRTRPAGSTRGLVHLIDRNNQQALDEVKKLLDEPQRVRAEAVLAAHRLGRRDPSEGPLPADQRLRSTRTR